MKDSILLINPPFFSPLTPPLGIATLKAYLESRGYAVRCYDFNVDPWLWGVHHKYFAVLQDLEAVTMNDGYSKLWYILNAHLLASMNGASHNTCTQVVKTIAPIYGVMVNAHTTQRLNEVVDGFYEQLAKLTDSLDATAFSVVGTSTYTTSLAASLFFLRRLKHRHPHLKTMMGGGVFADDLALGSENLDTLLSNYPFIDYVILGEGEKLFLKALQGEFQGKRLISIADICDETVEMQEIPLPDFSDFNLENYPHLSIEGARSCPFECSFCSETIQWGPYRKKKDGLLSEQMIELSSKYKKNSFFMGDSLMNPYIMDLSAQLIERNSSILYDGYLRADKIATEIERVKMWARSGMFRARLGVETASIRVLNLMNKKTNPNTIASVLKSLSNAGIRTTTYWVVGFPGETENDFQETLDFIQANYRYIYELEAHPYYYYPYGQVGSRLYTCRSLYPDNVTQATKFKCWDIVDIQPTRDERYDRLRRISSFAAEFGLPNIYTVGQRYEAEERWQLLHPLANDVYKSTRRSRQMLNMPAQSLQRSPTSLKDLRMNTDTRVNSLLCYHVSISGKLDEDTLAASLKQLVLSNDALHIYAKNGLDNQDNAKKEDILYIDSKGQNITEIIKNAIREFSDEIWSKSGASIRIVVIQQDRQRNDMLIMIHKALVDGYSMVLLLEDLFRFYEQLANKREIFIRPINKTYVTFLAEFTSKYHPSGVSLNSNTDNSTWAQFNNRVSSESQRWRCRYIQLGQNTCSPVLAKSLRECDLQPSELLAVALVRSLFNITESSKVDIDITVDCRSIDSNLKYTVGALTHPYPIPSVTLDRDNLWHDLCEMRASLRQLNSNVSGIKNRFLLNLEFLLEEPWIGGDTWSPQGFVHSESSPQQPYDLEIVPIFTPQGIQVYFKYLDEAELCKVVEGLINQLGNEVEALLGLCVHYGMEKQFWLQELRGIVAKPSPAVKYSETRLSQQEYGIIHRKSWISLLEALRSKYGKDLSASVLGIYAVLLSQLNRQEDVLILSTLNGRNGVRQVPIRLYPRWDLSFREFLNQVKHTLQRAYKNGTYVLDILSDSVLMQVPIFDIEYEFTDEMVDTSIMATQWWHQWRNQVALKLEMVTNATETNINLHYSKEKFTSTVVDEFGSDLLKLVQLILEGDTVPLGEFFLKDNKNHDKNIEDLAKETFNF